MFYWSNTLLISSGHDDYHYDCLYRSQWEDDWYQLISRGLVEIITAGIMLQGASSFTVFVNLTLHKILRRDSSPTGNQQRFIVICMRSSVPSSNKVIWSRSWYLYKYPLDDWRARFVKQIQSSSTAHIFSANVNSICKLQTCRRSRVTWLAYMCLNAGCCWLRCVSAWLHKPYHVYITKK